VGSTDNADPLDKGMAQVPGRTEQKGIIFHNADQNGAQFKSQEWLLNELSKMVVHTCNPSTLEAEARGSWLQGQPELYSENLSQRKKKYELTIAGIFHLIFSDCEWPLVTQITKSTTSDKAGFLYIFINYFPLPIRMWAPWGHELFFVYYLLV
jgi:hypothetical protein